MTAVSKKLSRCGSRSAGFTLVELIITLALVAILTMVAVPSFQNSIKNNRAATQSNELLSALSLARNESIKRNVRVTVCSSTNGATCAGSTNWANGWIVFVDSDNNGSFNDNGVAPLCETGTDNLPSEDCLLRAFPSLKGSPVLTATANFIQYSSSGAANAAAGFTFKPQDCTGTEQIAITINSAGRAYSSKETCT